MESTYVEMVIDAIAAGDPAQARKTIIRLMQLPPEAEAAMRQALVGELPTIPALTPGSLCRLRSEAE